MQGIYWLGYFFLDMYLPFGLRSAPYIFTSLMDLFVWICSHHYALINLRHFVDDFIYAALPSDIHQSFTRFQNLATAYGIPLKATKLIPPTPEIEYVGFLVNAPNMSIHLTNDKRDRLRALLLDWLHVDYNATSRPRTRSYHDVQSLLGYLMHVVQILPDGKIFCDRLIRLLTSWRPPSAGRRHLKPGIVSDLRWWLDTIHTWDGTHLLSLPDWRDLGLFTDASGHIGAGGLLGDRWWCLRWSVAYRDINVNGVDIFWKEMFAIWVSLVIWGPSLRGLRIILHSDSQPCVASLANGRAPHHPRVNELIRLIVLQRRKLNFELHVRYIPSASNPADSLSRLSSLPSRSLQEPIPSSITSLFGYVIDTTTY